jgi:hypothetical protein
MASLIPESVTDTFNQLLKTYGDIEAIKLQKRLTDAQISLASASLPSEMQDAQARAASTTQPVAQPMSGAMVVGIGLAAVVALYLIVK